MSLVLFTNAIEHVSRISRVINQPYGNALLVGVGGSGRKSLTTLAVSIADFKLFSIEISKSYGMADWREDMKAIMILAGRAYLGATQHQLPLHRLHLRRAAPRKPDPTLLLPFSTIFRAKG